MATATHPSQLYAIYKASMGRSDTIQTNAQKRGRLFAWNLLPPEIQDAWGAVFAAAPSEGQACYETFVASVDAAEPFQSTIMGLMESKLPAWAGLPLINQHAWDRVASITPAPTYGDDMVLITMPISGGGRFQIICEDLGVFDAVIDWGDSYDPDVITSYNQSELNHFYDDEGPTEYVIRISGSFPNIQISYSPDKDLLKEVVQLGKTGLLKGDDSFSSCANLVSFRAGNSDLSQMTNMAAMLAECPNLVTADFSDINIPLVTSFYRTLAECPKLTTALFTNVDTSKIQGMEDMFANDFALKDIRIDLFDISGLLAPTGLMNFMTGVTLNTGSYDAALISYAAQTVATDMSAIFGNSKYTSAATAARTSLVNDDRWFIVDSGLAP